MAEHLRDRHGRLSFAASKFSKDYQGSERSRASHGINSTKRRPQTPLYASTVCENPLGLAIDQSSSFVIAEVSNHGVRTKGGNDRAAQKLELLEFACLIISTEDRSQINLQSIDFTPLLTASIEPPVTKASLSELDITRILGDCRLRHDLYFERDVAFRPNYDGERGRRKKEVAKEYWTALAVEFALYIDRAASPGSSCLLDDLAPLRIPWRIPQMFRTIKAILKTLIRVDDQRAVDEVFDVELLVQQLEKGVCDLIAIAEWLSSVLKGSCSPVRDTLVVSVIDQIREAVYAVDPVRLANGIEQLFGLLERMKLDVANHQIRFLRLVMVNDGIEYEQRHFLACMASGMEVAEARSWYDTAMSSDSIEYTREGRQSLAPGYDFREDDQILFARAAVDLVCDPESEIPNTFVYDKERLQSLRLDFQQCLLQTIITESCCRLLRQLKYVGIPSPEAMRKILLRLWQLDQNSLPGKSGKPDSQEVVLEITRSIYEECNIHALPRDEDMAMVRSYIQSATDKESDLYHDILASTWDELDILIEQEVLAIHDLEPLQMLNYYRPIPSSRAKFDTMSLQDLAQRIAHIAVLHWRVWGPIVYCRPRGHVQESSSTSDSASRVFGREGKAMRSISDAEGDDPRVEACSCGSIEVDMDAG